MDLLAGYSSDEEEQDSCVNALRLPSAASFFSPAVPHDQRDDQSRHHGRKRTFEHVEGQFATHIYIVVPVAAVEALTGRAIDMLQQASGQTSPVVTPLNCNELHLSLSRTFTVQFHLIEPLLARLQQELCRPPSLGAFSVSLRDVELFSNDERTRWFSSLSVLHGRREIINLIGRVDAALKLFGLPLYYQNPLPHVTVAWTLSPIPEASLVTSSTDHMADIDAAQTKPANRETNTHEEVPRTSPLWTVNSVCCKVGARVNIISLT
eukprot:GILK01005713.1.p1 GENE.GILK01005713.1~~GILK01005713.1.p1  ORF type:complete len:265 (-),score=21.07 GILK01005713.1:183-977(-)